MRFMILVKASPESERGDMPPAEMLVEMTKFNEELVRAGVLLAAEGLHPSSNAMRIRYEGGERRVIDGPFTETKELVAGFWLIDVKSRDEAIEWFKRIPNPHVSDGGEIELRQVITAEDFAELQEQVPEAFASMERMDAEIQAQAQARARGRG